MVEFVDWLRQWNLARAEEDRAGLFGLDLYSMHASIESVLGYLDKTDPDAARRARQRYSCFEFFGEDPQAHGYATARGHAEPCEDEEIAQLVELCRKYGEPVRRDGQLAKDEYFYDEQNARLIAFGQSWTHSASLGQSTPIARRETSNDSSARHFELRRTFSCAQLPRFWLNLREDNAAVELLREPRLQRVIGVIYRPETERWSHYFEARLPRQFDAFIHLDETRALEPLERSSEWDEGELPETYPEGL